VDEQAHFPTPVRMGGRLFFDRHEVENHKRQLMRLASVERDPSTPIVFVTAQQISEELQIDRRTLGRRVKGRIRGEAAHTPHSSPQL
jgi:hypothetical protein